MGSGNYVEKVVNVRMVPRFVITAHPDETLREREAEALSDAKRVTRYRYDLDFYCLYLADISPIGVRGKYWSGVVG